MSNIDKHEALCAYLMKRGHTDRLTSLAVNLRLCEHDGWIETAVTRLWTRDGIIYYSTPSYTGCGLWRDDDRDARNTAYLHDQLLGNEKRDINLFH